MRTYTELGFYPFNEVKIARLGVVQGDHNLITPIISCYKMSLERRKQSYCFEIVEEDGSISYEYNLKNSEFESFKKHIPDFK